MSMDVGIGQDLSSILGGSGRYVGNPETGNQIIAGAGLGSGFKMESALTATFNGPDVNVDRKPEIAPTPVQSYAPVTLKR